MDVRLRRSRACPPTSGGPPGPTSTTRSRGAISRPSSRSPRTTPSIDVAERQLVIGICRAMFHQSEQAVAALVESMQTFGAQRPTRAAVAAVFLGRLHYFVHDSPAVANGWFARARRLVADQPDCIEHALAALPLPGCDIVDVTQLQADATRALALARRIGDANLEAKALADLGTAQVSRAFVDEGMTLLDEAMAMVLSGEASSPFAAIEVVCNLLSSCARVGDLARADQWTRAADRHLGLGIDDGARVPLRPLPLQPGAHPVRRRAAGTRPRSRCAWPPAEPPMPAADRGAGARRAGRAVGPARSPRRRRAAARRTPRPPRLRPAAGGAAPRPDKRGPTRPPSPDAASG